MRNAINAYPRKILYLTPSVRLYGARQSLLALTGHLNPERYQPIVVCPSEGGLADRLEKLGIKVYYLPLYNWRKFKFFHKIPFSVLRLQKIAAAEGVSLIHSNEFWSNPYAVKTARKIGVPAVSHMRLRITPEKIRNYYLDQTERIIVVSQAAARDFDHWNGNARVTVVYNGVDLSRFNPEIDGSSARRELGFGSDEIVLLMAGLISSRKRQDVAIRAMKYVAEKLPKCRLLILGKASPNEEAYDRAVHEMTAVMRLEKTVRFCSFRDDVERVFAAADINLLVSIEEGFGRVIIEAGAMGIPTIGTRIGGIPEVIEENASGLLIPPDNPEALADAILRLAEDEALRATLGAHAQTVAREKFSIESHALAIQEIYDEILG